MFSWYSFGLLALLLLGTQRFLYKFSAERKCNSAWTTLSFMATVACLSLLFFFLTGQSVTNPAALVLLGILNGAAFVTGTISHMEALKHIQAAIAYPLIRLNVVLVIFFSILFFKDPLSPYQAIGIAGVIVVIAILARQPEKGKRAEGFVKLGFLFVFIALISGAAAAVTSKFAAMHTNLLAFMALSYGTGIFLSFALRKKLGKSEEKQNNREAIAVGILMGLLNFAGFYAFLKALTAGRLSIIASLTGMHFVIAILLSVILYKEKLTGRIALGILITIVSLILLRL